MADITLIIAVYTYNKLAQDYIDSVIAQNHYSQIIVVIKCDVGKEVMSSEGCLLKIYYADSGIYDAWNFGVSFAKTKYLTFLGVGDYHEVQKFDFNGDYDILFPSSKRGGFFHCGSIFKTDLIRSFKFDHDTFKILADLDQFMRLKRSHIRIGSFSGDVKMEPGGMTYYASWALTKEYFTLLKKYPRLFCYVIIKLFVLSFRRLRKP